MLKIVRYNLVKLMVLMVLMQGLASARVFDEGFWRNVNKHELSSALERDQKINRGVAKNLVLIIGDGMGLTTTTATRVLRGQRTEGMLGEEALLSWDKFPFTGLSKTYATDMMTTDSAASATAYHCGVKTKYGLVGVDDKSILQDCSTVEAAKVKSVMDLALEAGKSVGLVTTDSLVGASPAAAYAHSADRDWATDADLPDIAKGTCKDIARQLIEDNSDIHVLLGGGREVFLPNTTADPEYFKEKGLRTDGKNLLDEWELNQQKMGRRFKLVQTKAEFDAVNPYNVDYLFGVFEPGRMQEETIRRVNNSEPSLAELVEKALKILKKNPKGYYLFVEGANIDKGHHQNRARYALEEGLGLDDAVKILVKETTIEDTLIVVSADHSHGFSFGGVSERGKDILSLAESNESKKDDLGNHYTILSYGSGPGYKKAQRENLTAETFAVDQVYISNFPMKSGKHGGEDVPIFAAGPMSHLFSGIHEQTFIAHAMSYAACLGENKSHCEGKPVRVGSANSLLFDSSMIIVMVNTVLLEIVFRFI